MTQALVPEHKLLGRLGQIVVVSKKNVASFFEFRGGGEVEKSLASESGKRNSGIEKHTRKIVVLSEGKGEF